MTALCCQVTAATVGVKQVGQWTQHDGGQVAPHLGWAEGVQDQVGAGVEQGVHWVVPLVGSVILQAGPHGSGPV